MRSLVVVAALAAPVAAESIVVVPADDTRTHAIASRREYSFSSTHAHLREVDVEALWFQVGLGPASWKLPFRGASMGELDRWTLRSRFGAFLPTGGDVTWAPLTFAAQRLSVHDLFSALPLIHLQTGIEVAFSTPWLEDRRLDPRMLGADAFSADTELARNGWSVRPASWHARADILLCRSIHVEAGVGPEVFRSTSEPDRGIDLGLRWRFNVGFSFACPATSTWLADVSWSLQYSARALLYNRDAEPAYDDRMFFTLQWQPRGHVLRYALFMTPDRHVVGARIQVELGGPTR